MNGTPLTAPAAANMAQNATGPFKKALIKYVAAVKKLTNVSQINGATANLNPELINGIKYAVNKANLYAKAGANGQVPGNAAATAVNAAAGAVEAGAEAAINPTPAAAAAVNANVNKIMKLVKIPPVNNKSSYNSINAAKKALNKVGKGFFGRTYGGPLPAITNKNRQIVKNYLNKLQSLARQREFGGALQGAANAQASTINSLETINKNIEGAKLNTDKKTKLRNQISRQKNILTAPGTPQAQNYNKLNIDRLLAEAAKGNSLNVSSRKKLANALTKKQLETRYMTSGNYRKIAQAKEKLKLKQN
jgi:hypothetical protein